MKSFRLGAALAIVVAVGLVAGGSVAPAASAALTVVTVKGHVRDAQGAPLTGIVVSAGCGCDVEPGSPPVPKGDTDRTDAKGYFSLRVVKRYVKSIGFVDRSETFLPAGYAEADITKRGKTYIADATLQRASELAGTILADTGKPLRHASVLVFDATTGDELEPRNGSTNRAGRFHALVPAGSYRVLFRAIGDHGDTWFGGASKEQAAIVTVADGGKTAGINGVLPTLQSITATITLDGTAPKDFLEERFDVVLTDANGIAVRSEAGSYFDSVAPGSYTLTVQPVASGAAFFTPKSVPVVVEKGKSIKNLKIDVDSVPLSADNKGSVDIEMRYTTDNPRRGSTFATTVIVTSYGSVKGSTITFSVGDTKLGKVTVPASGKLSWSTTFAGVARGKINLKASYSGTTTTKPQKRVLLPLTLG